MIQGGVRDEDVDEDNEKPATEAPGHPQLPVVSVDMCVDISERLEAWEVEKRGHVSGEWENEDNGCDDGQYGERQVHPLVACD